MLIVCTGVENPSSYVQIKEYQGTKSELEELTRLCNQLGKESLLPPQLTGPFMYLLYKVKRSRISLSVVDSNVFAIRIYKNEKEFHKLEKTPLHNLVKGGSKEEVETMLKEHPEWINRMDEDGKTPLVCAIEAHNANVGRIDIVATLIERGALVNLGDKDNWTPLYRASDGQKQPILELLVKNGAEINTPNRDGSYPLHRLLERGGPGVLEGVAFLIEREADVNVVNALGTPLYYAAKNGNLPIVWLLLNSPNIQVNLVGDALDLTPLAIAKNGVHKEVAALLEAHGAKEAPTLELCTDLHRQVIEADLHAKIPDSWLENEKDVYGRNAAHYCAALGKHELLLQMDPQLLDEKDKGGRTPLHYAIIHGQDNTVFKLLSHSETVPYTKDNQGYFPLHWACQYRRVTIAALLLEAAEEIGLQDDMLRMVDNFGWTAFLKAAQQGCLPIVQLMVEKYDIDIFQKTSNGRDALILAKGSNATAVVEYLEQVVKERRKTSP